VSGGEGSLAGLVKTAANASVPIVASIITARTGDRQRSASRRRAITTSSFQRHDGERTDDTRTISRVDLAM